MRDTTERPEGVEAGTLKLAGTKMEDIYRECRRLLTEPEIYRRMSEARNKELPHDLSLIHIYAFDCSGSKKYG